MPPPNPKIVRKLMALADLQWQAERAHLAEAQSFTASRAGDVRDLADQRAEERSTSAGALNALEMQSAALWDRWSYHRAEVLGDAHQAALAAESRARDRAIQEFGRVRALKHIERLARREQGRRHRAAQERDGQPES
jgi:hypothetical protein